MDTFTVAIYDFAATLTGTAWADLLDGFFSGATGTIMHQLGDSAETIRRRPHDRFVRELRGNDGAFWAASHVLPDGVDDPFDGWTMLASIVRSPIPMLVLSCEAGVAEARMTELAERTVAAHGTSGTYAIAYPRDLDLGPEYFAWGLIHTAGRKTVPRAEQESIGSWFRDLIRDPPDGPRFRRGWLRDAFGWNVLNRLQLEWRDAAGQSLERWINESNAGTLTRLSDQAALWRVPTESLPRLRAALVERGQVVPTK